MTLDNLLETASPPEVLWTLIGLLALVFNLWLLRDAWLDARLLERRGQNGAKKIAARTAIGVQLGLTVPQAIAVVIGVISLLVPPSNPDTPVTAPLVVVTVGIMLIEISLTLVAVFTRVRRAQLLAYLESTERDANSQRHAETMAELSHNTAITTEARDTAQQTHDELMTALRENTAVTIEARDAGEKPPHADQEGDR